MRTPASQFCAFCTRTRVGFLSAVAMAAWLGSGAVPAFAGGFINPSSGAKASSMAGAWIAQGDDLGVMDHNPAQLVRQNDFGVELHYTAYVFSASFDPAPVEGLGGGPPGTNAGDFVNHIPNLYAVFPIGERLRLGAGMFTPVGPRHTYGDDGAQRYQMQQAQISLVWPTIAAAVRIVDQFSAALSIDFAYAFATQKLALGLVPGLRTLDGSLSVEGSGKPTPRAKLGLLGSPADDWSIGLVFLHGIPLSIEGEVTADVPQVGLRPETARDNVVASQWVPTELRLGVGWTPEPFRAEIAVRWYRWSEYTEQTISLERNVIGGFAIDDLNVPKYYEDALAFQIGGGMRVAENHEFRLGYAFDMQANQNEGITIQDFDAPKHILAAGYGVDFLERYYANLSFNQIIYHDRVVDNSQTEPIAILGNPGTLGNGTYDWSVQTIGVQIGARF